MGEIYVTYVDDEHVDNHDYDDNTDDDHDNNNDINVRAFNARVNTSIYIHINKSNIGRLTTKQNLPASVLIVQLSDKVEDNEDDKEESK